MKPLILGTAQFGQRYGITNFHGPPTEEEIRGILAIAWEKGIKAIDTAAAYGDSETILGKVISDAPWRIISKVPKNSKPLTGKAYGRFLRNSIYQSLRKLRRSVLDTLLIHSAADLLSGEGPYLYDKLRQFQSEGLIRKLGVSVYTGTEIEKICGKFKVDVIQAPISILDQRLIESGYLSWVQREGIEVHARSIFLQGILLTPLEDLPKIFDPIKLHIARLHEVAESRGTTVLDLCVGFVSTLKDLDGLVIGVESKAHLQQILRSASAPQNIGDMSHLAINDSRFLHPGNWTRLN